MLKFTASPTASITAAIIAAHVYQAHFAGAQMGFAQRIKDSIAAFI